MKKTRGFLSVILVIFFTMLAVICAAAGYILAVGGVSSKNATLSTQAFYLAESGIQRAIRELLNPVLLSGSAQRLACTGYSMTDSTTFSGLGIFSAAISSRVLGPATTTTAAGAISAAGPALSSAITASSTTIPVYSAAGFSSSGRIIIDREVIDYAAISGNDFVGVQRGRDGTTAIAHSSNASVGQYQCDITAQGGVPSIASPIGFSTLNAGIQMQGGFAVGENPNATSITARDWNQTNELAWTADQTNPASLSGAKNLNGLYALSYNDAWAAGNGTFLLHWDGAEWKAVTGGPNMRGDIPNVPAIFCTNSNDCWLVGNAGNFFHWDGSAWGTVADPSPQNPYYGIYCFSDKTCWVLGRSNTLSYYNGSTWSNPSNKPSVLAIRYHDVACSAPNDCWIVGERGYTSHGTGTVSNLSWDNIQVPGSPSGIELYSIACPSATDCWTVGDDLGDGVIFHATGSMTSWTQVSNPSSNNNALHGVRCYNAKDCWSVGKNGTLLHYDGSAWSLVSSGTTRDLNAVSLVGANSLPLSSWNRG